MFLFKYLWLIMLVGGYIGLSIYFIHDLYIYNKRFKENGFWNNFFNWFEKDEYNSTFIIFSSLFLFSVSLIYCIVTSISV